MSKQHRNNKLITASITPAATEAIDILKEHYDEIKTSRVVDTVVKAHMVTLGYQLKEELTMDSVTMEIVTGNKTINRHASGGQVYFEAPTEGDYIIHVRNNTFERKEIIVSVDGLSVMDGEAASFETRGYVLSAYSSIDIKGWRRTSDKIATFKFDKISESYSALSGNGTSNVGVIGVAVFNEKVVRQHWNPPISSIIDKELYRSRGMDTLGGGYATTNGVGPTASAGATRDGMVSSTSNSRRISKGSKSPAAYNLSLIHI